MNDWGESFVEVDSWYLRESFGDESRLEAEDIAVGVLLELEDPLDGDGPGALG